MRGLPQKPSRKVLITGGAGFIGANLAAYLLGTSDAQIRILDNLSAPGANRNLNWLKSQAGSGRLEFMQADVRHRNQVREAVRDVNEIFHLATTCGERAADAEVNVEGTVNVLQSARDAGRHPAFLYLSTCKVYESLDRLPLQQTGLRYTVADPRFRGISESMPVDLHSPFACAKGLAERAIQEQAAEGGVSTVVLRVDTVAGPRQFADRDHGWVAHLVYSVLSGKPVTVYGNGFQVRDVLHATDLVEAMLAAHAYIGITAGHVYNVGGGMARSASVNEMISLIERVCHRSGTICHESPRPGDLPFYVSDSWNFLVDTGWMVRRTLEQTIRDVAAFWHSVQGNLPQPRNAQPTRPEIAAA